jgi:hypothetical protein
VDARVLGKIVSCVLGLLVCFACAGSARAEGPTPALRILPGATCIDPERLSQRLSEWLGAGGLPARTRVLVQGDPQQRRRLAFSVYEGEQLQAARQFHDLPSDCGQAHAVVALALAIAVRSPALAQVEDGPQDPARRKQAFAVEAAALFGSGFAADFAGGAELGVGAVFRGWAELHAHAVTLHAGQGAFSAISGAYAVTFAGGLLEGCAAAQSTPWLRLRLCSGALAGGLHARGRGFPTSKSAAAVYVAWAVRAGLELALGANAVLSLSGLATVPLLHPALTVRDTTDQLVGRLPLAATGLAGALGAAWMF